MRQILIPLLVLTVASLTVLSSVSRHLFLLQCVWFALGWSIVLLFRFFDWRGIVRHEWCIWGLYGGAVLLLFLGFFVSPVIRNTRSWLVLGPFNVQPVELAKVGLILAYAAYFSRRHFGIARWNYIFTSFVLFALPAAFVALQPDLGSMLILFGVWFGVLLFSGLPPRRVLAAFLAFAVVGILGWHFGLKDYQRARIRGVFYPEEHALTVNYSVTQSKIAIGSAGFFGKGYGQGTQTQLGFLTEPANDFVLAALIEEWGIVGGFLALIAFLSLLFGIFRVGMDARHNFEKLVALGTSILFLTHFIVNAGSAVGFFPVVGVTFPFLSYGGSSILTDSFLLAIINAIGVRNS